jgi:molybdate transport system substrate-binding protein
MKNIKNFLYIILIFLSSCQVFPNLSLNPTSTTSVEEITIAAAADLQFAFTDIVNLYEQQTGRKVTLVFGSTGQLVQQIEN